MFELIRQAAEDIRVPVYIVGGYVRDRLLGRPSNDMDVVCVGDGIALARHLAKKLQPEPYVAIYQRFGTAMLKHEDLEIEFVGARKESYSTFSRKPDVESGTLEDDQNRRDFTINALAVSLNDEDFGQIIDSFNGFKDLEDKIIRTPLDPDKTFSDDPLRMMRAIRFATQLDFVIEDATYQSIVKNKQRIHIISKERIASELEKIIRSEVPSKGFKMLFDTGLLHIIFPEMAALHGIEVINNIGHKDNFYHTLEVLDNVSRESDQVWLRWAAVMHDIAKPPTKRFDPALGWTFHGHETLGAAMVPRIFKRMKLPLDHKMKYVQKLVMLHLRPIALTNENVSDSAVRRLLFDAGEDIEDLMTLCKADITSKNEGKVQRYKENYDILLKKIKEVEEKDHLRNWQPPISGDEIMKMFDLKPSREVGILKTMMRDAILDGEIANDYQTAYDFLVEKYKALN
ncbi:MAG: CCA tRNA nucleotidyltransferase [Chitinophagales bacterium]|nr:CCA tRNA nucleotidyltransferase [Chitinophagales bacterium]